MQSPSSAILPMQTMSLCTLAKQVQEATRRYSHVSGTIDLTISRNGGTDSPGLALYMSMSKINLEETDTVLREYTGRYGNSDVQTLITSYMNVLEAVSIAVSEPKLNLQRGRWNSEQVTQYYQWSNPDWFAE